PGTLSLDGMTIAWRRCLFSAELVERCPMPKCPDAHPKLGQPHHVALDLHGTCLPQERQDMVTNYDGLIIAVRYQPHIHRRSVRPALRTIDTLILCLNELSEYPRGLLH
ncbi:MAG: hypothetical protein WA864_27880, partial [Acetobacteraceae bacterium]